MILCFASGSSASIFFRDPNELYVATFNLREHGTVVNDGLGKAAELLVKQLFYTPDVIALQETGDSKYQSDNTISALLKFFPSGWTGVSHCNGDIAIITKHTILGVYEHVSKGMNVRIELKESGREISFWAMHLSQWPYGPYVVEQEGTIDKIYAAETNRINDIVELLHHPSFVDQIKNSDNIPVIVAGCFNTPSHLDWTYLARDWNRGFVIEWPVTKLLSEAAGMTDAYREHKPQPHYYDFSWPVGGSEIHREVKQDRIDYIFYRGSLKTSSASDRKLAIDHPSDHMSVRATFQFTPRKHENTPSFSIPKAYIPDVPFKPIGKCAVKIIP